MANRRDVSGTTCAEGGCPGVALLTDTNCWAHADGQDLEAAIERLRETGRLDARGVSISEQLLDLLLANLPQDDQDHVVLTDAHFEHATFQGDARFTAATFQGAASFNEATFQGDARFTETTFHGAAWFSGAAFEKDAHFSQATFYGAAWFSGTTFQRHARFNEAAFQRDAQFDRATIQRDGWFLRATFHRAQQFGRCWCAKGCCSTRQCSMSVSRSRSAPLPCAVGGRAS